MRVFHLVLLGLTVGCGTETGNPEDLLLSYNAVSSDPANVRLGPSEGGVSVENVWLRLADVQFEDCEAQLIGTLPGIGFADHAGEEAAFQTLTVDPNPICTVRTELFVDGDVTSEPAGLEGASVALSGALTDGRRFELVIRQDIELNLLVSGVVPSQDTSWLMAFDVASWLDEEELNALPGDPLIFDEATASAITGRIQSGVRLIADENNNGQLETQEPEL